MDLWLEEGGNSLYLHQKIGENILEQEGGEILSVDQRKIRLKEKGKKLQERFFSPLKKDESSLYMNTVLLAPFYSSRIGKEEVEKLTKTGFFSLHLVQATKKDKSFELEFEKPSEGPWQDLLGQDLEMDFAFCGEPQLVLGLSVRVYGFAKSYADTCRTWIENWDFGTKVEKLLKERLDMSPQDAASLLGSEQILFSDEAGVFFALRLESDSLYEDFLTILKEQSLMTLIPNEKLGKGAWMLELGTANTGEASIQRFHWMRENNYLIFSGSAQALAKRQKEKSSRSLKNWLEKEGACDNWPKGGAFVAWVNAKNGGSKKLEKNISFPENQLWMKLGLWNAGLAKKFAGWSFSLGSKDNRYALQLKN